MCHYWGRERNPPFKNTINIRPRKTAQKHDKLWGKQPKSIPRSIHPSFFGGGFQNCFLSIPSPTPWCAPIPSHLNPRSLRLLQSLAATTLLIAISRRSVPECTHPTWLGIPETERNQDCFHFLRLPISILLKRGRMRRIRQEKKKEKENMHKRVSNTSLTAVFRKHAPKVGPWLEIPTIPW